MDGLEAKERMSNCQQAVTNGLVIPTGFYPRPFFLISIFNLRIF
jgi:hypothetical protein